MDANNLSSTNSIPELNLKLILKLVLRTVDNND